MKERPINFTGAMVRAILDGSKTMTRRVVKPQPTLHTGMWIVPGGVDDMECLHMCDVTLAERLRASCPYGVPGDRLWVRESFSAWWGGAHWYDLLREDRGPDGCTNLFHRATHHFPDDDQRWVPSIFMPRWASRLTLEIMEVRAELLQGISEADAMAEGCVTELVRNGFDGSVMRVPAEVPHPKGGMEGWDCCRDWFADLWDSINAKRGYGWDANPWVWVIGFKRWRWIRRRTP